MLGIMRLMVRTWVKVRVSLLIKFKKKRQPSYFLIIPSVEVLSGGQVCSQTHVSFMVSIHHIAASIFLCAHGLMSSISGCLSMMSVSIKALQWQVHLLQRSHSRETADQSLLYVRKRASSSWSWLQFEIDLLFSVYTFWIFLGFVFHGCL